MIGGFAERFELVDSRLEPVRLCPGRREAAVEG